MPQDDLRHRNRYSLLIKWLWGFVFFFLFGSFISIVSKTGVRPEMPLFLGWALFCGYTPNFKLSQREKLAKHHLLSVACFGVGMCLNALVTQGFNIEQITRSMTFLMGVYLLAGSLITRALLRQTLVPGFLTLVEHV